MIRYAVCMFGLFASCREVPRLGVEDAGPAPFDAGTSALPDAGVDAGALAVDAGAWRQVLRLKSSFPRASDYLGVSVTLSGAGDRLVVGRPEFDGFTAAPRQSGGRVILYEQLASAWTQLELAPLQVMPFGGLGWSVAASEGAELVVAGAPWAEDAGAAVVWERDAGTFMQLPTLWGPAARLFGCAVATSPDATVIAIGSCEESATYVFERSATGFVLQQRLPRPTSAVNSSGMSLAFSGDARRLVVGASGEDTRTGAVYVFERTDRTWVEAARLTASNRGTTDRLGISVAISRDGSRVAAGAPYEDSSTRGVNGPGDDSALNAGAVYVWRRQSAGGWVQEAFIKPSNTNEGDLFGFAVAFSSDATQLMVGAIDEGSLAPGIDGDQLNNDGHGAGAAYEFVLEDGAWSQRTYFKVDRPRDLDGFAGALALSGDGTRLLVGSMGDAENGRGVNPAPGPSTLYESGAAFLFERR